MNVVIHADAETELAAVAEWYEQEREGLGDDLLIEADWALDAIAESPST